MRSTSSDTKEKKEKGGKKKKTVKEEEKEGSLLDLDGWGDNKVNMKRSPHSFQKLSIELGNEGEAGGTCM